MDAGSWLDGLEGRARPRLDPVVDAYVATGGGAGLATARAQEAWREPRLAPRTLVDVSHVDPSVTVLGRRLEVPWGVAPTTLQRAVHPDGERGVAEAVRLAGGLLVVSSNAGTAVEDVGATGVRWWLQLYLPQRRPLADALLDRAVAAGAETVVLTVDTPVVATKRGAAGTVWDHVPPDVVRVNFEPGHDDLPGAEKARDLGAHDVARLRARTGLPVVAKGVLRPDDARRWVGAGAAAVWVSNHGGRQLDRVVPTATALPRVAAAVGGDAEVYVDGGLRDGLDVVTALALGAGCCFLGRPVLWALGEGGRGGVERLHAALLDDVVEAMTLAGAPDVAGLRTLVDTPS